MAAFSLGSASASSIEFVCSDWVPPMTAANAWTAVRMRFTSGCCAVSETPAVWVWKRIQCERSFFAPKRSFISRAQMRRAARNLATSSKKSLWQLKKKERRAALLRGGDIHRPDDGRRRIYRHRCSDFAQRQTVEQCFHVSEGRYPNPTLSELSIGLWSIRVVAVQGRQIEGDREA